MTVCRKRFGAKSPRPSFRRLLLRSIFLKAAAERSGKDALVRPQRVQTGARADIRGSQSLLGSLLWVCAPAMSQRSTSLAAMAKWRITSSICIGICVQLSYYTHTRTASTQSKLRSIIGWCRPALDEVKAYNPDGLHKPLTTDLLPPKHIQRFLRQSE